MPLTNLNNVHLTAAQIIVANNSLTALENALLQVDKNLTPDDRKKYGSINEQNKLFVNKVNDFHESQPELDTAQVEWTEFAKDHSSRLAMENFINRLESIIVKLKSAKILHDYDNYQAALIDYGYTSYMAGTGAEGFETKMNELKQFFAKTSPKETPKDTE